MTTTYERTQRGPLALLMALIAFAAAIGSLFVGELAARIALNTFAIVFAFLTLTFAHLTVTERGDHLAVRFGPLPLWGTKVRYDTVTEVRTARSRLVDGLGIHWLPGRGWTFNLWGFDCVEVTTNKGLVRIGTDDPEGLREHLRVRSQDRKQHSHLPASPPA